MHKTYSDQTILIGILAIGLVLRLLWALLIPVEPSSDSQAYDLLAKNLALHGVYGWSANEPSAYWAVGTSAILAGLYSLFGLTYTPLVIVNILVSMGVIYLGAKLSDAYFGRPSGLVTAGILAFWPSLIMFTTIIASEILFIFFILLALVIWETRRKSLLNWALIGASLAIACYLRPVALLVPIVMAISEVFRGRLSVIQAGVQTVSILAVILLLIAPWTYRNYKVMGHPVLISTNFGPNFWMGNNPNTNGGYQVLPEWIEGMHEVERSSKLRAEAIDYILKDPIAFVQRTVWKAFKLHERETIAVHWNLKSIESLLGNSAKVPISLLATAYWSLILLLSFAGLYALFRSNNIIDALFHPMLLLWAYFTAVHAVIVIGDRYHFPNIPMIAILASQGFLLLLKYRPLSYLSLKRGEI